MQNFAARVLTDTKKFHHISPVHRELEWPSIKDQLLVRTTQVYKIINSLALLYLSGKLSTRSDVHNYDTNLVPRGPFCHALEESGPLANRILRPIPIGC